MYCLANFCCICFIRGIEKKLSNIHEAKSNENSYFYKLRTCIPAMVRNSFPKIRTAE